jgi:hypothetical protein
MSNDVLAEVEDLIAKIQHLDVQQPNEFLQKRLRDLKDSIGTLTMHPSSSDDSTVSQTTGNDTPSTNLCSVASGSVAASRKGFRFPFVPVPIPTGQMKPSLTGAPSVHFWQTAA